MIQSSIQIIQQFLVPFCFVFAWAIIFLVGWSLWAAMRETIGRSRQMHQIPCANCQFFTKDYHLKCTVHPSLALTEDAIGCPDHQPTETLYRLPQESVHH